MAPRFLRGLFFLTGKIAEDILSDVEKVILVFNFIRGWGSKGGGNEKLGCFGTGIARGRIYTGL